MSRDINRANIPSVPRDIDRSLSNFLLAVKESIEVGRGRAGDDDTVVTKKYLRDQGFLTKNEYSDDGAPIGETSGGTSNAGTAQLGIGSVQTQNIADKAVTESKLSDEVLSILPGGSASSNEVINEVILVSVADIAAPTELGSYASNTGALLLAYQVSATVNLSTLYQFDSANSSGASSPYVVAGSSGFWTAVAGAYAVGPLNVSGGVNSVNYRTIYVDAGAMVPCTTNGAESGTYEYATNDINWDYMAFDAGATEERVQFKFSFPEDWDLGTVKVKFYWTNAAGASASDTIEWGIKAGALSNDDAIDAALGTPVTISDTVIADGDLHITSATAAMTIAGTPAKGDIVTFEVYRNTDGTDDMTEDGWLEGVLIQYATSATAVSSW